MGDYVGSTMLKLDQVKILTTVELALLDGVLKVPLVPRPDGRRRCSAAPVPPESGAQDQRLWTGPCGRGTLPEAAERGRHAQVRVVSSPLAPLHTHTHSR